ncbi:DUF5060 domain-containing protein [Streptomyces sp. NPDC048291]|uniref:DUF5060 domain-containing protein n=1 Tax=Streptomyces sp. NPDC048291 TaxID=3365530 RepID=UPI003718B96F
MTVEQWDIHEIVLTGPNTGNPFLDVTVSARFTLVEDSGVESVEASGFYDGDGTYRIRFMPHLQGEWRYETVSDVAELNGVTGGFACTAPSPANHGPVRVHNTFHFAHADGTGYKPVGTTAYAWTHQGDDMAERTLRTLSESPFNKIRMCVFPKHMVYNANEPELYPFEGTAPGEWDFTRFDPAFFRNLEHRVGQLRDLGIEADVILFHPYDEGHWGFDRMPADADDRYLRYVVARLAAYRNVWWSMANEFDLMTIPAIGGAKTVEDFDRYFQTVRREDPYDHLRSNHNGIYLYDHNKPWVTHASIQMGFAVEEAGRP